MKSTIFLLSCLLVGTFAKPSTDIEVVKRRRSPESEEGRPGGPQSLSLPDLLANLPNSLPAIMREIPNDISEITSIIPQVLSDDVSMDTVMGDIQKLLKQVNPLHNILNSIPVLSTVYTFVMKIASLPLSIIAKVIGVIARIVGVLVPGFSLPGF